MEDVKEALLLHSLGVLKRGGMVTAPPKFLAPTVEPTELLGDLAHDVAHECSHLMRGVGTHEHVEVIGQEDEGVELDTVSGLGAS